MAENIYDEIEIEDMTYDKKLEIYHYPCPCGDRFEIAIADLRDGEEIAVCPSCSLMIKVIFEVVSCLKFSFCSQGMEGEERGWNVTGWHGLGSEWTVLIWGPQDDLPKPENENNGLEEQKAQVLVAT